MTVTTISAMPASPSRLGDPSNFITESLAFLDAQAGFVTQCNSVSATLNAGKFNPNDWGDLGPVGGSSPVSVTNFISATPTNPPLAGQGLADAIDDMLATFNPFIADANTVAAWIDGETDIANPSIVDPTRPTIQIVNPSPLRNDGQNDFESKALSFYGSARAFSLSLQGLADYVAVFSSGYEDWSEIDIVYTETDDWGFIA
jgi:hypothetical protein